MAIKGSSTFTSESSVNKALEIERVSVSPDETQLLDNVKEVQKSSKKWKAEKEKQEKSGKKGKRRQRESMTLDWESFFMEMRGKSMEQGNARFEWSAEMFHDVHSRQMELSQIDVTQ